MRMRYRWGKGKRLPGCEETASAGGNGGRAREFEEPKKERGCDGGFYLGSRVRNVTGDVWLPMKHGEGFKRRPEEMGAEGEQGAIAGDK